MDPLEPADRSAPPQVDRFGRSRANRSTENEGLRVLLSDGRFQVVDLVVKRRIVEAMGFGSGGRYGTRTFDAVMTPAPAEPITGANLERHLGTLRLIEMKTSRAPVPDATLRTFFFGATQNEYELASLLGDRYLFAFVVLNDRNVYGRPFAVLLTLDQVESRTKAKRVQFQVNLGGPAEGGQVEIIVPGAPLGPGGTSSVEAR